MENGNLAQVSTEEIVVALDDAEGITLLSEDEVKLVSGGRLEDSLCW